MGVTGSASCYPGSVWIRIDLRKGHPKCASVARTLAFSPDSALMRDDKVSNDGQPQTEAGCGIRVRRGDPVERIKEVGEMLRSNSRATILHRYSDFPVNCLSRQNDLFIGR